MQKPTLPTFITLMLDRDRVRMTAWVIKFNKHFAISCFKIQCYLTFHNRGKRGLVFGLRTDQRDCSKAYNNLQIRTGMRFNVIVIENVEVGRCTSWNKKKLNWKDNTRALGERRHPPRRTGPDDFQFKNLKGTSLSKVVSVIQFSWRFDQ